jgi:predicted dehydrogenase
MVFRLFGAPAQVDGARWSIHSTEVEDVVTAKMRYRDFSGELLTSWSIPGYPRPQNLVEVQCERGTVVIENFGTSVRAGGRTEQLWTQRDFDVGYNASPDYTGAGFAAEHRNFVRAVQKYPILDGDRSFAPVNVEEAADLEEWMFGFYRNVPLERPTGDRLLHLFANREILAQAQLLHGMGR